MIDRLPYWVLTSNHPAFNDTESLTAIEMVARLYGKMNELVESYNELATKVNAEIDKFETDLKADFESFKDCINELMQNYISSIDTKIALQDDKIADTIEYIKDHLEQYESNLFTQALAEGTIQAELGVSYDAETESLTFSITAGGE